MKNELLAPWVLRNVDHQGRTAFSGDDRMPAIDTCSGWEMCECVPILDHWHTGRTTRVVAMRAAPELLSCPPRHSKVRVCLQSGSAGTSKNDAQMHQNRGGRN